MNRRAVPLACSIAIIAGIASHHASGEPCNAVTTFADGLAPSAILHVATDGSDQTGDGSFDNSYATIEHAAQFASPGTAVRVHAGAYAGGNFIYDLTGAADAPIWIGGAPGEARPVIEGSSEGLHLIRAKYVVLHDLEVRNTADNGVNCDDGGDVDDPLASHHLVFRNLYIHDIGGGGNQDGLKLSGINDYWVLNCEIHDCGGNNSGSGVDHVGCHHGLIASSYFHDLSANAVQCKGGSQDIEIRWCRIVEAGQRPVNIGGSTGFQFFRPPLSEDEPNVEARDIRVVANLISGAVASVAYVGCVECVVADNTLVTPHNWLIRILQETTSTEQYEFLPCGDNVFKNNLVYFDRSDLSTYVNIGPNTAPETFTFTNDLWYAYDNPSQSEPTLPVEETDGIYGQDPLLADPSNGDFDLNPASPAVGAGSSPASVVGDYDGVCYRDPPTLGAFEIVIPGDLNCDAVRDESDVGPFVQALIDPAGFTEENPACDLRNGDFNDDALVDGDDIAGFVECVAGGACP